MKKFVLAFLGLAVVMFSSCKKTAEQPEQATEVTSTDTTAKATQIPKQEFTPVTLNNGQKWMANVETTREIAIMQGLLREFPSEGTVEDYRGLHKKLLTGFQYILQKCTMKDEAYTQLQNYMLPLSKLIDKIGTGNLETCNSTFPEIQGYLMKYSHYFF